MTNYYYDVDTETNCTNCGAVYDGVVSRSTNERGEFVDWCDECDDDGYLGGGWVTRGTMVWLLVTGGVVT